MSCWTVETMGQSQQGLQDGGQLRPRRARHVLVMRADVNEQDAQDQDRGEGQAGRDAQEHVSREVAAQEVRAAKAAPRPRERGGTAVTEPHRRGHQFDRDLQREHRGRDHGFDRPAAGGRDDRAQDLDPGRKQGQRHHDEQGGAPAGPPGPPAAHIARLQQRLRTSGDEVGCEHGQEHQDGRDAAQRLAPGCRRDADHDGPDRDQGEAPAHRVDAQRPARRGHHAPLAVQPQRQSEHRAEREPRHEEQPQVEHDVRAAINDGDEVVGAAIAGQVQQPGRSAGAFQQRQRPERDPQGAAGRDRPGLDAPAGRGGIRLHFLPIRSSSPSSAAATVCRRTASRSPANWKTCARA